MEYLLSSFSVGIMHHPHMEEQETEKKAQKHKTRILSVPEYLSIKNYITYWSSKQNTTLRNNYKQMRNKIKTAEINSKFIMILLDPKLYTYLYCSYSFYFRKN